tara:strand:- start:657 stop:881 length:225 start_codon:yes stop_codon:yes gene_type:complete
MSDFAAIQQDVIDIKITLARIEERGIIRAAQSDAQAARIELIEGKLSSLDKKVVAAMGALTLLAWGFQLLAPTL